MARPFYVFMPRPCLPAGRLQAGREIPYVRRKDGDTILKLARLYIPHFLNQLGYEVEASKRGDEIDAGALFAAEGQEVAGHRLALGRAAFVAGAAHALADGIRYTHAGHLGVEELGVAGVVEGEHADDDRQVEAMGLVQEALEDLLVEHVLRYEEVGAGFGLAPHKAQLWLERVGVGVAGGADEKVRLATDGLAGPVDAFVEELQEAHEADGADVPHAYDVVVAADRWGVAAQTEDAADAERVSADHIRVDGQGVTVASGVMHDDFEAEFPLEEDGHGQGGHADLGGGVIADVDGVHAGLLEQGGALEGAAGAQAVGRGHLRADDEAAGGQLLAQGGPPGGDVKGDGGAVRAFAHSRVSLADGRRGWQLARTQIREPGSYCEVRGWVLDSSTVRRRRRPGANARRG